MTNEEKYFEDFLDLFTHPGWIQYVKEAQQYLDELDTVSKASTADEFFFTKGRVSELTSTVKFEDFTRQAYESYMEDQ